MKKPIIILTGPTAVGKTALSIALAKRLDAEIISADSMQVYRGMDIGSAKITPQEMCGVPHHLIDILEPEEEFNVVVFQRKAKEAMDGIYSRGRIPLVVGGTGFYIQALLYDIDFTRQQEDRFLRRELEAQAASPDGALRLHARLARIDPEAAKAIHAHNVKRVIRALEYYGETGRKISSHNEEQRAKQSPYRFAYFVLNDDRDRIYARIEERVDLMVQAGLVEEVERLKRRGCGRGLVSMQGLGYKEILRYLDGEITLEQALYLIKRDTRRFAKRQLTWFRRERDVTWMERQILGDGQEVLLEAMLDELRERGIWEK